MPLSSVERVCNNDSFFFRGECYNDTKIKIMIMKLSRLIVKFRQHTTNILQVMRSARNASPYEALCCTLIGCFRYLFQTEPPAKFEIIEEVTSNYMKVENEVLLILLLLLLLLLLTL